MSNLTDSIQSTSEAFNCASIILIQMKYFDINEERYQELREMYHEIYERARELGDPNFWEYTRLPRTLMDARLKFVNKDN
jgi:hypothetical protein